MQPTPRNVSSERRRKKIRFCLILVQNNVLFTITSRMINGFENGRVSFQLSRQKNNIAHAVTARGDAFYYLQSYETAQRKERSTALVPFARAGLRRAFIQTFKPDFGFEFLIANFFGFIRLFVFSCWFKDNVKWYKHQTIFLANKVLHE